MESVGQIGVRRGHETDLGRLFAMDGLALIDARRPALIERVTRSGTLLVAELEDKLAGYVLSDPSFYGQEFIHLLVVAPAVRRRGVGCKLLRELYRIVGAVPLWTSIDKSNRPAQRFFQAMSFQSVTLRLGASLGFSPDLVYRLTTLVDAPDDPEILCVRPPTFLQTSSSPPASPL